MGYPMTWRRVKNRNHLSDDLRWDVFMPRSVDDVKYAEDIVGAARRNVENANITFRCLRDDIERMETDALDEGEYGPAWTIARNTGIDQEVVARVLAEFFSLP